jgi:hypothetical protein
MCRARKGEERGPGEARTQDCRTRRARTPGPIYRESASRPLASTRWSGANGTRTELPRAGTQGEMSRWTARTTRRRDAYPRRDRNPEGNSWETRRAEAPGSHEPHGGTGNRTCDVEHERSTCRDERTCAADRPRSRRRRREGKESRTTRGKRSQRCDTAIDEEYPSKGRSDAGRLKAPEDLRVPGRPG